MHDYLDQLPEIVAAVDAIRETVITNIVLVGQVPSPTFREKRRIRVFLERMAELRVDECTTDGYRNPIGIIRGKSDTKPPIFVVAHLDTISLSDNEYHYSIGADSITGRGITDNSAGIGVLLSLPEIFRKLHLRFQSDIVLAGVIQSIGRGNLRGIRHLLKTWSTPIRGAVCVEGVELGRLNYYSDGMIRAEIECNVIPQSGLEQKFKPNAILVLNEVINRILELRLPQRPRSRIIFGKMSGGSKHGDIALEAKLGLEIQSTAGKMVKPIFADIRDIVEGISHEYEVNLDIKTVSNVRASRLKYNHPLVKSAGEILRRLDIKPISFHCESELSIFLSRNIPAVTLGISRGKRHHLDNASIEIGPMSKGIAQVVATLMAIDNGVCDGKKLA